MLDSLDSVVASLEGITEINFRRTQFGQSRRAALAPRFCPSAERTLPAGQTFGRMVMLAPPNRQPELATKLVRGAVAEFVAGPAAQAARRRLGNWSPSWPRRISSSASWPAARATIAVSTRSFPATTMRSSPSTARDCRRPRFPRAARAAQLLHERQPRARIDAPIPRCTAISKAKPAVSLSPRFDWLNTDHGHP